MMEYTAILFTLVFLLGHCCAQLQQKQLPDQNQIDPCLTTTHKILNETYRSTGFDLRPTDTPRCDESLRRGWYKFVDLSGVTATMPTTCQGRNRCGTKSPYWIEGRHPTSNEGIVQARICAQLEDGPGANCCGADDWIFVRNCGDFYVYNLQSVAETGCVSGYCAGDSKRCLPDQVSSTGFEPCKNSYPLLKTLPAILGPSTGSDLKCVFEPQEPDVNQRFQVIWTFDGKQDPGVPNQVVSDPKLGASLTAGVLEKHLQAQIVCQVITFYEGAQNKSNPFVSSPYFMEILGLPVIELRVKDSTAFQVLCQVTWNASSPDRQVEVGWLFDGREDPNLQLQTLTDSDRTARLDGLVLRRHLNKNISCRTRATFPGSLKSEFKQGKPFFYGIRVEPTSLELRGSDVEKELTVISSVPVVCDGGRNCCLTFQLKVSPPKVVYLKDSCEVTICSSHWDNIKQEAAVKVKLAPYRSHIAAGVRRATLTFEYVKIEGSGPYMAVFSENKPNPVQIVLILEPGFECSLTGDPHITGYDGKKTYHLYSVGDFVASQVRDRDFVVQVKTWVCGRQVSCVCGVVVKEHNDMVKLEGCSRSRPLFSSPVTFPYPLSAGTTVLRSPDGRNVGITLPSGSEIKITLGEKHMNVFIRIPASDKAKTLGVCGTNDGDPKNDFTHPSGRISPWKPIPNDFTQSWRVTGQESLFKTIPKLTQSTESSSTFCLCDGNNVDRKQCSASQHTSDNKLVCQNCRQIKETLKPKPWEGFEQVKGSTKQKRATEESTEPVDPDKQWPSMTGLTLEEARSLCNSSIFSSPLVARCQSFNQLLENSIEDCLGDILYGETTEFVASVGSSFNTLCLWELARDEKNYVPGTDGELLLDSAIMADLCPIECLPHGRCNGSGQCLCDPGWEGDTCQRQAGQPPNITSLNEDFLPYGDIFEFLVEDVDLFDQLYCVLSMPTSAAGRATETNVISLEGSPIANCTLPSQRDSSLSNVSVAVSRDSSLKLTSNQLTVTVFDPTCLDCNGSVCTEKQTTCHINNVCYTNGQVSPVDHRLVCDVKRSITSWSDTSTGNKGNKSSRRETSVFSVLLLLTCSRIVSFYLSIV